MEEADNELFRTYTAQCLWSIDAAVKQAFGSETKIPQYIELVHPETKQKKLSTEDIKQRILERLK